MIRPVRTAEPAGLPVTLAEFKAHARVDHDDEDTVLTALLTGAVNYLDGYRGILGRCIIEQDWQERFKVWPLDSLRLAFPDVSSVAITYVDDAGATQTLSSALYEVAEDGRAAFIHFLDTFEAPALDEDAVAPIMVDYTSGMGADEGDIDADLKTAIYMLAAHWYAHREASGTAAMYSTPLGFSALIAPYRRQIV